MKQSALKRRIADARMPGPVYRDVHPEREIMSLYGPDDQPSVVCDMPASMMRAARQQAKRNGVSPAELLVRIVQAAMDKHERGF